MGQQKSFMKTTFLSFLALAAVLLTVSASTAQSSEQFEEPRMCDIVGMVEKVSHVAKSPWSDGTPTTMTTTEVRISVFIADRKPHDKNAKADDPCHQEAKDEKRTYKLCSPTPVKRGDRIHGTEGTHTGAAGVVGCLFDLIVLPPATHGQ